MRRIKKTLILLVLCSCFITGCEKDNSSGIQSGKDILHMTTTTQEEETSDNVKYDVKELAVVINVDIDNRQVVLKSLQDGQNYILTYTGACDVRDKYGDIIAMSLVDIGEIVEAYYINAENKLTRMYVSSEAFEYQKVTDFSYDEEEQIFVMKDEKYRIDDEIVVTSNGKDIELSEISEVDILTVKGVGKTVNSIMVTNGHGYIKLEQTDYFEGGIIEIGQKIMLLITKDMLITAPEGTYNITATIGGKGGTKEITVKKDEEIRVSLTDFQDEAVRYGSYSFEITPADAILKIDGKKTLFDTLVELPYGSHRISVEAEGYDGYTGTIVVDSVFEDLTIDLTKEEPLENEENDNDETKQRFIHIDSPADAEVYFDGIYKGVAPVSFEKASGTHIITLRKNGYLTKMYTLEITEKDEDVHFVLPDMIESNE